MTGMVLASVIASALMHALYNSLIKTSRHPLVFLWSMFSFAVAVLLVLGLVFAPAAFRPGPGVFLFAAVASVFYTLYQSFTGLSYGAGRGDLSVSYPLTATGPVYIPLLAYAFIGETVSLQALAGIVTVVVGSVLIQLRAPLGKIRRAGIDLRNVSVRFALLAGFFYSFGSIADKAGISRSDYVTFTSWIVGFMFGWFSLQVLLVPGLRRQMLRCYRLEFPRVALAGLFLLASFYLYRHALALTKVSYAASVRMVSVLFAVLIGVLFLKEPYGPLRIVAGLIIIAGVVLISAS